MSGCICAVSGFWAATSLFTLVVLSITVFICVSYTCFGHFKYLSPHNYEVSVCLCVQMLYPSLSSCTLSITHVFLQVKEDDEETPEGLEENTTVLYLYLFHNKLFHINIAFVGPVLNTTYLELA